MPPKRSSGTSRARLTPRQLDELHQGPAGDWEHFDDDDQAEQAWRRHRAEVMAYGNPMPGRRPWAFWRFEHPRFGLHTDPELPPAS